MNEDIFQLGIKALIFNQKNQVLLLKVNVEQLTKANEPYWDIPGGRIHRNDSVEATLRREVEEETGIKNINKMEHFTTVISNIRIPYKDSDTGLILSVYKCLVDDKEISSIKISEEHTDFDWFDLKDARELLKVKYPEEFTSLLFMTTA